jgi:hypothetical protein
VLSAPIRRLFLESLEKAFGLGKLKFFGMLEPSQGRAAFGSPPQRLVWDFLSLDNSVAAPAVQKRSA